MSNFTVRQELIHMLHDVKIGKVHRLLAAGVVSQRRIAKMTGVSRGTVSAIANGTFVQRKRGPAARLGYQKTELGPLARCPGCGGKVYLPCRLCYVRALQAIQHRRNKARLDRQRYWHI